MSETRGRLEKWMIVNKDEGFEIFGLLFDDSMHKFLDNTYFHTSKIKTPIVEVASNDIVESQKHLYLLGEKTDEEGSFVLVKGVCVRSEEI